MAGTEEKHEKIKIKEIYDIIYNANDWQGLKC